ncbi:MAG: 6-phosphogluconolactonase [Microbacterium sp.]|nr:6-phosphogluconolactonase [Microbacterium sp.]
MTSERQVIVLPDRDAIATTVARRFFGTMAAVLASAESAHLCLTGGTMGIQVLEAIGSSPAVGTVDWKRVHLWWGDERYLPRGDPQRNDEQARKVFLDVLDALDAPAELRHRLPASDEVTDIDEAARIATAELRRFAAEGAQCPRFDICFLGVGPDGHVASLFPNRAEVLIREPLVVPVRDSPKPPPLRLSMTRSVLNGSARAWMVLAGADKASPIGLALAGAQYGEVPVAGVKASEETVFFIDEAAAAELPQSLTLPSDEFHSLARLTRP